MRAMAWNLEDEQEGRMMRTVDGPHKTALCLVGFDDPDLTNILAFPASKRELLDRFMVKLVAYPDHIDVKATSDIAPIGCQNVTPSELERGGTFPLKFVGEEINAPFHRLPIQLQGERRNDTRRSTNPHQSPHQDRKHHQTHARHRSHHAFSGNPLRGESGGVGYGRTPP